MAASSASKMAAASRFRFTAAAVRQAWIRSWETAADGACEAMPRLGLAVDAFDADVALG